MTRIGILCSAHGFGHVARQLAVAEVLMDRGADVEVWTAAPREVVHDYLPRLRVRSTRLDVGLVQSDSLHEDLPATADALRHYASEAHVRDVAEALEAASFDAIVVDAPPVALEAARRLGVPAVLASNFDWAWIYSHYSELREISARFAAWQEPHPALRMTPGTPMTDFARVDDIGVVGRWRPPKRPAGTSLEEQLVLVSFGGFGLHGLDALLPVVAGVRWLLAPPMAPLDRPDCTFVTDLSYPAMVGGVDRVLTKPGYGIYGEAALGRTQVLLLPRRGFPESPYLTRAFVDRGDVLLDDASPSTLRAHLECVLRGPVRRPPPVAADGAVRVAERVLSLATAGTS